MAGQSEDSDLALRECMTAYQAGDPDAFDRLFRALAPEFTRYFLSLVHDHDHAQDLLQDTFLRIHQARRSYDPAFALRPWAFAIARHVFLMDRRSRVRRTRRETSAVPSQGRSEADRIHAGHLLRQLLAPLSAERRRLLFLRYIAGFDFREIGRMLQAPTGAVRLRACRVMADLRRALGEQRP